MTRTRSSRMDDMAWIGDLDRSDMLSRLMGLSRQCREAFDLRLPAGLPPRRGDLSAIGVAGMGGSAIGGDLLQACLAGESDVPIFVNRDYTLPKFVDASSFLFVVSYSGNTEETLSAFDLALARGVPLVCIASGGRLKTRALEEHCPLVEVPAGLPPRAALGYLFFPMLAVLSRGGFCLPLEKDVEETIALLKRRAGDWHPAVPIHNNYAKQLALKLFSTIPILYGNVHLGPVVRRWKTQFQENAGIFAHGDVFPESAHNEIMSWPALKAGHEEITVVLLRDPGDGPHNQRRMEISKAILGTDGLPFVEVWAEGQSPLARLFFLVFLGDFVSYYLAVLGGVDPTPVERIEEFKRRLGAASSGANANPSGKEDEIT